MAKHNKSYRIRTTVGIEADSFLDVHLDQDYDSLEILSLKISDKDTYKLHNSDYGVVVGRVLANGNFGVPNAKISVFIPADEQNSDMEIWNLYPYESTSTKNDKDIRYNLLPDRSVKDCHKAVGTFPHKTYLLENDSLLEVFDDYYIYTTRTNAAGDYLICGVPTGMQTLHMDLDLSDCGILSQRPRDFVYKGYTIEQFENPNQFKKDENIDGLSQIFSQDQPVYVQPFWGNEDNGEEIGITRADIQISFKFEPTCVFMGSAISDNASNGVGKKCVPTNQMGAMDELTAGEGTIEMIRKTPGGHVEEFAIKGNQVINGNGVWCYQIPMNLDYMMTDEYGNMVPTDDPEKGIPTRARVRFRASLTDMEDNSQSYYRAKYLIPNNPGIDDNKVDYNFGTYTEEDSFRDLFWNGVYTVKSYIPRFQKSKRWRNERFTGIKACNYYGGNNPVPYNNMRIKLPFMFTVLCIFVKLFIKIVALLNRLESLLIRGLVLGLKLLLGPFYILGYALIPVFGIGKLLLNALDGLVELVVDTVINKNAVHCTYIGDGLCPDMEGWYFAPACGAGIKKLTDVKETLMKNTLAAASGNGDMLPSDTDQEAKDAMNTAEYTDETSIDNQNMSQNEIESVCLTTDINYLVNCFEMNLAEEYRVIKFDFYNDWVNGVLYFPRWMRKIKRKKKYKFSFKDGIKSYYKDKVLGCMNSETSRVKKSRYYTQQCSLAYSGMPNTPWTAITTYKSCYKDKRKDGVTPSKCHKSQGMERSSIFGKKSGLVTEETTMLGQYVYYLKPCEWKDTEYGIKRTLLFATDIVLLGTLNDCDENGVPQAFKYLNNSSYIMPTNLALTTMDDDAYIYAPEDGTVCSPNKSTGKSNSGRTSDTIRRITPDYQSTYSAYNKTDGEVINYEENDDPVPVTESAGISWNYSGPGQDDVKGGFLETSSSLLNRLFGQENKRFKYLYYPGGHFLGLSCTNSETNIKSCVNLKRICELGATMSQRREEIRGYTSDGEPKYRYYVPTGLISNVDIETAEFRSMFATLNHNKLVATERNEFTGYKKYNFRFLRPDGFDGSLGQYVHSDGSPYNKVVNSDGIESVVDSRNFFESAFRDMWQVPDDYDGQEAEFTERRTVEDSIDDYYMFRFGLDTFADVEQRKHYLKKIDNAYSMPQYENSFYFYFGLKDGATALDEFKKQFFSECEANKIARTPEIYVKEKIKVETVEGHDQLELDATLFIEYMNPTYVINIKDNTSNVESKQFSTEDESVSLNPDKNHAITNITLEIGHEYTVTVTDTLGRTLTTTFVFGASAIKADATTIHFRKSGTSRSSSPKEGGYIKIGKDISVLGVVQPGLSVNDITIKKANGATASVTSSSYTDAANEEWFMFFVEGVGQYDVFLNYLGNDILIYSTTLDDNTKINLFTSTNYLAYKQEYNENDGSFYSNLVLSGLTDAQWHNGSPFQQSTPDSWLMRHTYYRQEPDKRYAFNDMIYTNGNAQIAIFGQPEKGNLVSSGTLSSSGTTYKNDYERYLGYSLDETYIFYPTMYWDGIAEDPLNTKPRNTFDAMSYTEDGRAAADASSVSVNGYSYDAATKTVTLSIGGLGGVLKKTHGCIVVLENGQKLFGVVINDTTITATSEYDIYAGVGGQLGTLLSMATVYPTLEVPTMYKPFYAYVSAATWNVQALSLSQGDNGETVPVKNDLQLSYKVEGDIYNGLTYGNKFYSGGTNGTYDTYLIFNDKPEFWSNLVGNDAQDWNPQRLLPFGRGTFTPAFGREISGFCEERDVSNIMYAIKEGIPANMNARVYTERYEGGIDQEVLSDTCVLANVFQESKMYIKAYDASAGTNGLCSIYSEAELPNDSVKYYLIRKNSGLIVDSGYMKVKEDESNTTFAHGYYNEKSKNDKKGSTASVEVKSNNKFKFSVTQDNGAKVTKTVTGEQELYDEGVTLTHKYILGNSCKDNLSVIANMITSAPRLKIVTNGNGALVIEDAISAFTGNDYEAIVGVYLQESEDFENKMLVYRIYAIGSLDVLFPASDGGVAPYLNAPSAVSYNKEEQTVSIPITTNVQFSASTSVSWISAITPSVGYYASTSESVQIKLALNEDGSDRSGTVTLHCTESGVSLDPVTITIYQSKDEIADIQSDIDTIEGQIRELSGNTSS